jgi:HK97 family phage prohead protease
MAIIHKVRADESLGFEFVLSDETPDRYGDVISAAGWQLENFRKNPVALFGHRNDFIVGNWKRLRVENRALRGDLVMAKEGTSDRIDEVRKLVEADILRAVSVGFRPIESKPRSDGPGEIYTKQELVECSLCSVPANPNALAVAKELGISRKTMAMVFADPGIHATITEPSDYQKRLERREAVLAKALTVLDRLDKKLPRMLVDIEARRRRLIEDDLEFVKQFESGWPRSTWSGHEFGKWRK